MLVNAPNASGIHDAANTASFPHMGIVSIGTQVQKKYPNLDVRTVDGGIRNAQTILSEIDSYKPDVVGIAVLTPTYSEGLRIAQYAKETYGSIIVLGDDHANFFPSLILDNQPSIDYIVQNDVGEIPFTALIGALREGNNISTVPSLVYRVDGKIVHNQNRRYTLKEVLADETDIPNLDLLGTDLEKFAENYRKKFGRFHKNKATPITINNVRGCGNGKHRCTYCSIYDLSLNAGNPRQFWETVSKYRERGINFFFEVADSFGTFGKYIDQLVETMPFDPKSDGVELMVYARAQEIAYQPKLLEQFRKLNITRVNMGLDTGDPSMLVSQRKGNKRGKELETNTKAVKLLHDAGITIHASFIAGALGETGETLKNTVQYINNLMGWNGFSSIEFSRHIPLPNSPTWDLLLTKQNSEFYGVGVEEELKRYGIDIPENIKKELREKYGQIDMLDLRELAEDWITHFTHLKNEKVEQIIQETDRKIEAHNINIGANVGK